MGSVVNNPSLSEPRTRCTAYVVGDTLYVVDGESDSGDCLKSIEALSVVDLMLGCRACRAPILDVVSRI